MSRCTYVDGTLPSSMKRRSVARVTPPAPATASSAVSCQGAGLKRSGRLRTRRLRVSPRLQSDAEDADLEAARAPRRPIECIARVEDALVADERRGQDRKSTRLNSSHQIISYAVFCLK